MKDFILMSDGKRVRKNTIKKYSPSGERGIKIWFSITRYKVESEDFFFSSTKERQVKLMEMDEKL